MQQSTIPQELWDRPQWVVWRYETRNERPTKVPYNPRSGERAKSDDPLTWGSAEDALRFCAENPEAGGIGFVVNSSDPFAAIDLDHCLYADGTLASWAQTAIERFPSYTEYTPSGEGLRIWLRGKLPVGRRRKDWSETRDGTDVRCSIEMYDTLRFFTVTGRPYGEAREILDAGPALLRYHAEVFPAPVKAHTNGKATAVADLSDLELLSKAGNSRYGVEFNRAWNGDLTAWDMNWSRADWYLIHALRFWTGNDRSRMDRLFRQSGLIREKWDDRRGEFHLRMEHDRQRHSAGRQSLPSGLLRGTATADR